ncbi:MULTISPECIES: class I SAM-dependent methyltransferase [unclassified Bacillus (in: firmicutes)]|uniref:tRNA (mnm(5)s(2)U34)-methyltransferase n=1 Tax=unclassified Bacillus (in: firmicutes) TaxID=185979 RepID=UPI0008DFA36A|nr:MULTISPECIES: class I SAM-dependent methyltransferase [unclassified Bacillus (in: firmicutes)]SFB18177.1 Putative rRNA methylase [Bacillus sp. UNCCL13]SFQ76287.1 Putative rRNA methylase [Bacillus sp. cl95]
MNLDGILPFARKLLEKAVTDGNAVVDATLGNGHDTLYLANLVGSDGHVFGFDIQKQAIETSLSKISEKGFEDRVTLFHSGHENLGLLIPTEYHGKLAGAIFNLGYLPGSDKSITTTPLTTISALNQLMNLLKPGGIIVIVIYHGHEQGKVERDHLIEFAISLDQTKAHVLQYQFINQQNNPPFIIAIEKRPDRN